MQNNSGQCKARIEEELAKTEGGQARLGKAKDRIDHWVAREREREGRRNDCR